MFSLKKGIDIFKNVIRPMDLTKIEFAYETSKEDEELFKLHFSRI